MMTRQNEREAASFRDPAGFLFWREGIPYRQVNLKGQDDYELLMESGLYDALVDHGQLIPHTEVDAEPPRPTNALRVIRPETIPFVSYPYEWCFSQLKDAALLTLDVQRRALDFGMSLKDCSAYNVQFSRGNPVLIDTLSFEAYREGEPWVPYGQFCRHFLAPLALMSYKDVRLGQLLRVHIDGIPLDLASSLLPLRTRLVFSLLTHIHLHARSQGYFADKTVDTSGRKMGRTSLLGLVDSLQSGVERLRWQPEGTEWADYYESTSYASQALEHKKDIVSEFLAEINPESVWDLGANVGTFSRVASEKGIETLSLDSDHAAVERNYLRAVEAGETRILPMLLDLTNPSASIGWEHRERKSLLDRGPADLVLALALVHHLAISNNLPLDMICSFLSRACSWLIIEFVPKSDSQVQRLLSTREDIFPDYTQRAFENVFERRFAIRRSVPIRETNRTLYLMERARNQ